MSYGQPIDITLPVVGVTSDAVGSAQVTAAIQVLEAILESKVTPAGFNVNSDMSFKPTATSYAITGLQKSAYDALAALLSAATNPRSLFSYNGELYYNDGSARQIQLTNAGSVNAAAGNVTGAGYGTGGVEVNWDSGTSKYRMRSGTGPNAFADVEANDVFFHDSGNNFTIRMACPTLAADRTFTLPTAPPGTDALMQMTSAGVMSASNTVANLITASGGLTAAAGQHVTVSSTGLFKHGSKTENVSIIGGVGINTGATAPVLTMSPQSGSNLGWFFATSCVAPDALLLGINPTVGSRILTLSFFWDVETVGTNSGFDLALVRLSGADSVPTTVSSTIDLSMGTSKTVTLSSINHTVLADNEYYIRIAISGSPWDRNGYVRNCAFSYDQP